ncbi:MAG: S-adenosylmethionine decarboxylase [Dehalococcoidales bacterium]
MNSMEKPVGITYTANLDGEVAVSGIYGKELALDCYGCLPALFNRAGLQRFFDELVELLGMEKGDLHFWDDVGVPEEERQARPETKGTSAIQFILTSNITIHCLDILGRVYVNIFSCKDYSVGEAKAFVQKWFRAKFVRSHVIYRD